ncbi:MAG TPA: hypothetical protein VEY06_09155 [Flavisolibacter sp.]|nr:hypothetical protein [Flavisolibacter sp.]
MGIEDLEDVYHKFQAQPHNLSFFDKSKKLLSASFIKFPCVTIFEMIDDSVFIYAIVNTH